MTACVVAAAPARAQGPLVLSGRLVRVSGRDTLPVAGVTVVGHHVGAAEQGPVDSVRSDAAGRFRIVIARPDTVGLYVVSARHDGIGYFGTPVAPSDRAGAGAMLLSVFDTATAGPALTLAMRHLVLTAPEADGSRRILDILQVHNDGTTTRVGADSAAATWRMRLPPGVVDVQPGEGEVPTDALRVVDGELVVTAPLPPGDKQIVVSYAVPRGARRLVVPIDQATARIECLVEGSDVDVSGAGTASADPIVLEGRAFRRYSAEAVGAGAEIAVALAPAGDVGRRFLWVAVLAAASALGGGAWIVLRRRGGVGPWRAASAARDDPQALAVMIAALDERYEGRESETPPDAWQRYRARRAELKERARAALARDGVS